MSLGIFTSNWDFSPEESELRSKFQMVNIAIILSSISLIYGAIGNVVRGVAGLIAIEVFLISINIFLFFLLRKCKNSFYYVALIETVQFTLFFLFLVYVSAPEELKHIWLFTYPMILLYFQNQKSAIYWVLFMISGLLIAPLQPFVAVQYSLFQVSYISFVIAVISIIIYLYQKNMDEAKEIIRSQKKIMALQSKHAIMGEMISMIAHQWRQPLSTITLTISNFEIQKMLGKKCDEESTQKMLEEINKTILYLSNTIDDFQTFFRPNRVVEEMRVENLLQKAINFVTPRIKEEKIVLSLDIKRDTTIYTYPNELVQVILNLLNNAIDALLEFDTQEGKIVVSAKEEGNSIRICVEDNARGIEQENMDKLFEPYFSTKGKNGTGLGLYMSQMIMEKQFGTQIQVSSSSKGSSFAIIVPKKLQ
ncbi:MAG: HAMP domain-containing histidine kinase [Campylobacterales bacterium]|nr:HAMP domain-containing histidine kinase [Campylobacterales bacterium]